MTMSGSIAGYNEKRGFTKWVCNSCRNPIAHGYYVEGKIISVMRETRFHEKTYVCATCMPAAIQAMTLAIDKQIHVLMDPWVTLPNYDPTEDLPEHISNVEILIGWGVPKEEQERRSASRSAVDQATDRAVRDAIRAKAIELGIDVAVAKTDVEPAEAEYKSDVKKPS